LGLTATCSGYTGYPVIFSEGDLRQMVRFGHIAKLGDQWESFGQFNRANDTIEWRIKDKKPYAAILRYFIENSNNFFRAFDRLGNFQSFFIKLIIS